MRAWIGFAVALCVASAASALEITGLSIAKGGSNTADDGQTVGQNFFQTTSAVSTTQAPVADGNAPGDFSEFITRYEMMVAADRQNTTGTFTANMTSSYSISFTVDNPTGASVQVDINTLLVGSLTNVTDSNGNSVITLNPITGQLNAVADAGLGAPGATLNSSADADAPFSQAGTTVTFVTNAISDAYVLQFDWTSSVTSTWDEGAIRLGMTGTVPASTADDYPGVGARTQSGDGHFVTVRATIISVPEPGAGGLVALGLLGLAIRARRARH